MSYEPRQVAQEGELQDLKRWLNEELRVMADIINKEGGNLERQYVMIDRPRDGDYRYFNSAVVSAAAAEGIYFYHSDTWELWL